MFSVIIELMAKMKNNSSSDDDEYGNECSVKLSDCLQELVKFTLNSHSHHLNLSSQFCSTLLKHDATHSQPRPHDSLEGVPQYPLYKWLASALLRCMDSETFCKAGCNLAMAHDFEDSSMQQKQKEWHKLIVEKGLEIVNILKRVSFELHVQEPFFSQLNDGLKTVEGRCATGKYNRFQYFFLIQKIFLDMHNCYIISIFDFHISSIIKECYIIMY